MNRTATGQDCVRRIPTAQVIVLALFAPPVVHTAPPNMQDYAQGVVVESYTASPMIELALPDPVYQTTTRADLRDLRVFNANGAPVAHAFCAAPDTTEAAVTEQSVPVFELRDAKGTTAEGARIEVQTADGTQVNVQEPSSQSGANGRTHIIDLRQIDAAVRSIQFDWASPDGASEAKVRIEASDDLDRWETMVAASTLLRAAHGEQELRRERIELPLRAYEYLRVERADGGPALAIHAVSAERVAPANVIEPLWFTPNALAAEEPHVLAFDAGRLAPVRFARVRLPQDNSSMNVTLQSRADDKAPWRTRWSGETYIIAAQTERRESPPARFEPTTDRYWRVLLPKEAQASPRPAVELGYRPLRLRFLAQGGGPYTVAFGSRRAEPASPAACNGLLGDVTARERRELIGEGLAREFTTLGGETAFKPQPKKTPTRMIVLWSVLIVGVGLLVAIALSLLKRVRPAESG
jgi:hypothetical protein